MHSYFSNKSYRIRSCWSLQLVPWWPSSLRISVLQLHTIQLELWNVGVEYSGQVWINSSKKCQELFQFLVVDWLLHLIKLLFLWPVKFDEFLGQWWSSYWTRGGRTTSGFGLLKTTFLSGQFFNLWGRTSSSSLVWWFGWRHDGLLKCLVA